MSIAMPLRKSHLAFTETFGIAGAIFAWGQYGLGLHWLVFIMVTVMLLALGILSTVNTWKIAGKERGCCDFCGQECLPSPNQVKMVLATTVALGATTTFAFMKLLWPLIK